MPTLSKRKIPPTHTDAEFERLGNRFSKAYEEYMKGQALAASGWYAKGDFVIANSVIGAACVVGGFFTGGATIAAYMAMQAAINANKAYDEGGGLGLAVNVGTLVGSAAVQAYTAGMMSFDISYTRDGGFGGAMSFGKSVGVNASVGYSEKGGYNVGAGYNSESGSGFGLSYSQKEGFGGHVSTNISGMNVGLSYSQKGGYGIDVGVKTEYGTIGLGLQLDDHGGFQGWNAKYTSPSSGTGKLSGAQTFGIGFNEDTGYNLITETKMSYGSDWRYMDFTGTTSNTFNFGRDGRFSGATTDTKMGSSYNDVRANEYKRLARELGISDEDIQKDAEKRREEMNWMEKAGDMLAGAWLSMNNTLGQWGRDVAGMVSEFGEKAGNFFAHGEFAKNDSPEMQRVRDMQMAQQMWGDSSMETIMAIRAGTLVGDYTFTGDGSYTVSAVFPGTQRDAYSDGPADLLERIKNFKDTNPDRNVYDYLYEQYKDQTGGQYDTAAASETLSRLAREMGMTNQEFKDAFNGEQRDVSGNTASALTPINPYGPMGVVEYGGIWNSVKSFFGFGENYSESMNNFVYYNGLTLPLSPDDYAKGNGITQGYSPENGHYGIDISLPNGTPLFANEEGRVDFAGYDQGDPSFGNYLRIRHSDGSYTYLGHLNQFNVRIGQEIRIGHFLGRSGDSGTSTRPHLHFEKRDRFGRPINPFKTR